MKIKKSLGTLLLFALCLDAGAIDNRGITFSQLASGPLYACGKRDAQCHIDR